MEIMDIIKSYFENLNNGDYDKLMELFAADAVVFFPLYGKKLARDFYKELIEDSDEGSEVELLQVFANDNSNAGAGNFEYTWILKESRKSTFEGVDLFEFDNEGKIKQVKIIYDTYGTRVSFDEFKNREVEK